jgi:hypothetical protein
MITVEELRSYISGLAGVEESGQGGPIAFAVGGAPFLYVEDRGSTAVASVDEDHAASVVCGQQDLYEEVWRGEAEFVGIRIDLARAPERQVRDLVVAAWRNTAPAELLR